MSPRLYAGGWLLTIVGLIVFVIMRQGPPIPRFVLLTAYEASLGAMAVGLIAAALAQTRQRQADGVTGYAGPSPFLVYAALMAAVLCIGVAFILGGQAIHLDISSSFGTLLELLLNLAAYVALVGFLVVRTKSMSWSEMLRPRRLFGEPAQPPETPVMVYGSVPPGWDVAARRRRRDLLGDVLLALALVIPCLMGAGWLATIAERIFDLNTSDIPQTLPSATGSLDRLLLFLGAAIVAPIGEEIFFRGFSTTAWAKAVPVVRAVVQGGIFFAAVHITTILDASDSVLIRVALVAVIVRIPVALALCWIFLRRRSIYASMTLHGAYNGLLLLIQWSVATGLG